MTTADVLLVLMFGGLTAYALFGGADFGAGFWDLVARRGPRSSEERSLIEDVIGPVWEANHVWLIFAIVVVWTAFPPVFAAVASTLYIPLTLVAFGIILRGAGFRVPEGDSRPAERGSVRSTVWDLLHPDAVLLGHDRWRGCLGSSTAWQRDR